MSKRNRALRALAERERLALMEWIANNRYHLSSVRAVPWNLSNSDLWIYNHLFNNRLK